MPISEAGLERQEIQDSLDRVIRAMTGKYRPEPDHSYSPTPIDIQRCMEMRVIDQLQARLKSCR